MNLNIKKVTLFFSLILMSSTVVCQAQTSGPTNASVTTMKEVVVTAQKDEESGNGVASLPDVQGAKIYSGKKTSVIDLEEKPPIVNNNQRQVFQKTPGVLLSEESTPLFSLGYRGLNPDRAQFMQVMKDGIPIVADLFGYPEAYYIPPAEVVEEVEFVRGGSALQYGPQPGGAINFVTKDPVSSSFYLDEQNSVGSHDLYSNYTALSGTQGALGHYSYFHHRQSQGFRDFNSQYEVYYGGSKIVIRPDDLSKWTVAFDIYEEAHGEPGGLTRTDFDMESTKTTRLIDHFELNRYAGSIAYERELDAETTLDWKFFIAQYERFSWRQRGGGFGALPTGAAASTIDIQKQEFDNLGTDLRLRKGYSAFGSDDHQIAGGVFYYHSDSPRIEERGTTGDALSGDLRKDSDRSTDYLSFFLENMFKFGRFSVTPGVRLENIWQSIEEKVNVDKTTVPLGDDSQYDFVALAGVGANFEVTPTIDLYANYSESYRPKVYADAVPLSSGQVTSGDLEEGNAWQADLGLRGDPTPYLAWDVSIFHMEFDGQTGTVGNTVQNVGDAEYEGVELAVEFDVIRFWDALSGDKRADQIGSLKPFYVLTALDAEFVNGPNTGKTPQYAPDTLMKGGVEYAYKDRVKVQLAGTFADDHFGDDGNTDQRIIPSYKVWDLTAEVKVYKDIVSIFGGINNLFDENYFARVTSTGIDPADGRNYYGGVTIQWG